MSRHSCSATRGARHQRTREPVTSVSSRRSRRYMKSTRRPRGRTSGPPHPCSLANRRVSRLGRWRDSPSMWRRPWSRPLDERRAKNANGSDVIRKTVATSGSRCRFMVAICDSLAKSLPGRRPRTMAQAPRASRTGPSGRIPLHDDAQLSTLSPMLSRVSAIPLRRESSDLAGRS